MTHQVTMILDLQYGSTGKGLIAGYLAKREKPDTVTCAFATNAGHTYIDKERGIHVMTQQIPTAILASPDCKTALIGPGALIHRETFLNEVRQYGHLLKGKQIMIHPHAAIVEDYHGKKEMSEGYTKIGSTAKGVGEAMIERIRRHPEDPNVAGWRWDPTADPEMGQYVCTKSEYDEAMNASENLMVEGAQGFGLSMYHGFYPYTTSRDVTPWQTAADCGLPYKLASYIKVVGTMRTYPIRVNNRDGWSGPTYPDQCELSWEHFEQKDIAAELTTVTKLKRRIFTFSRQQAIEATYHCGGYWDTRIFLNFANYCGDAYELQNIIRMIEDPSPMMMNPPSVMWLGYGPDDSNIHLHLKDTK